ncbi:MAG: NAD(P)/FAD-dependent oxidoreductase [Patescibacteria group bacterium]|jgi:dihydrolipoamide dehydrogenase|nr:NAD(P)/FAD-dependent oxidoreductase [Patescibacteria group bacterium]
MALKNRKSKLSADVIVIGGGAAGTVAAQTLHNSGKTVIVIENGKLGGDCAHHSCIPTRSLLESANLFQEIKKSSHHGISVDNFDIDFNAVIHAQKKAITATGVLVTDDKYGAGIKIVRGHAHFIDNQTITVGLNQYTAKYYIIANGSYPYVPDINGLSDAGYLTYRSFQDLKELPKSMLIIGGGPTAYEYSQILRAFDVKVHIIESKDHILNHLDPEASDLAENILTNLGVAVHTKTTIKSIAKSEKGITVNYQKGGLAHGLRVHAVMLACGNKPSTDIGLENLGIDYNKDGITVNKSLRTSQKNVYAIGDITGLVDSAGGALLSGQIAAHNIMSRKKIHFNPSFIPRAIFGTPEIATVGTSEKSIILTGQPYQTSLTPISIVGRSFTKPYQDGFVKIIASNYGTIIGATIVAPNASEIINELALVVKMHIRACDVVNTPNVFGSWGEAVRVAASKIRCI